MKLEFSLEYFVHCASWVQSAFCCEAFKATDVRCFSMLSPIYSFTAVKRLSSTAPMRTLSSSNKIKEIQFMGRWCFTFCSHYITSDKSVNCSWIQLFVDEVLANVNENIHDFAIEDLQATERAAVPTTQTAHDLHWHHSKSIANPINSSASLWILFVSYECYSLFLILRYLRIFYTHTSSRNWMFPDMMSSSCFNNSKSGSCIGWNG